MRALKLILSFNFLFFISFVACGAILLSLGPAFQQHSVALLSSQSPSIYQSVYSDSMITFRPVDIWFVDALSLKYIFGSLFLFLSLKRSTSFRGAIVLVSFAAFSVHMIIDIYAYLSVTPNSISLFECFVSNALGGVLLSFIYVSIAKVSQSLPIIAAEHPGIARLIYSIVPISTAALTLLIQYYVLVLFFNPSPSYVEARVGPDAAISLLYDDAIKEKLTKEALEKCKCEQTHEKKHNFNFLSGDFIGSFLITGQGSQAGVVWNPAPDVKADVIIQAYDGCYALPGANLPKPSKSLLLFKNMDKFEIKLPVSMMSVKSLVAHGDLRFQNVKLAPIWLSKEDSTYNMTRFISEKQSVEYRSSGGNIDLLITIPLLDFIGESSAKRNYKELTIVNNDVPIKIKLLPSDGASNMKDCSATSFNNPESDPFIISSNNVVSLRLLIKPTSSAEDFIYDKRNHITFNDIAGWYSVSKITGGNTKNLATPGLVQGLSISGGLQYLSFNGRPVENLVSRTFTFYNSSIETQLSDDSVLVMKGESNLVWVDRRRLSPTRWENMDIATQGILLGLAGVLTLGLLTLFRNLWKANPVLSL